MLQWVIDFFASLYNRILGVHMPSWDRQKTGIEGLEQDVAALYTWARDQFTAQRKWLTDEIGKVNAKMASYSQAVDDALAEFADLSARLKTAIESNDSAGVQAAADRLENAVQALNEAQALSDAGTVPTEPPPVEAPPAGTDNPSV